MLQTVTVALLCGHRGENTHINSRSGEMRSFNSVNHVKPEAKLRMSERDSYPDSKRKSACSNPSRDASVTHLPDQIREERMPAVHLIFQPRRRNRVSDSTYCDQCSRDCQNTLFDSPMLPQHPKKSQGAAARSKDGSCCRVLVVHLNEGLSEFGRRIERCHLGACHSVLTTIPFLRAIHHSDNLGSIFRQQVVSSGETTLGTRRA